MKFLITGASSGIGEALSKKAAQRKHDLVLVARRLDRLEEIADELRREHTIVVEVLQADLTSRKGIDLVIERINKKDIDVLINNAGFGSSGPFIELDIKNELNEIELNVSTLVELSHASANAMVEKKRGTIVNISSIASYQPMAGNAVYGATKAFVTSFSHALREELGESGVNVMVVCPGPTTSEFFERSRWSQASKTKPYPKAFWQTCDEVAEIAFKGLDNQKGVVIPGVTNKLLAGISSSLPGSVTRKVSAFVAKGRRLR